MHETDVTCVSPGKFNGIIHYRSSVYYDELKAQLLETDKDKLEGTSLSHALSGKRCC